MRKILTIGTTTIVDGVGEVAGIAVQGHVFIVEMKLTIITGVVMIIEKKDIVILIDIVVRGPFLFPNPTLICILY